MYNVHPVKHLKVAEARARFGELLDQAEQGTPVIIERRGVRFRLAADAGPGPAAPAPSPFEYVDAAVLGGQWTWKAGPTGLRFGRRRRKAR
jgi:hypothetical protein